MTQNPPHSLQLTSVSMMLSSVQHPQFLPFILPSCDGLKNVSTESKPLPLEEEDESPALKNLETEEEEASEATGATSSASVTASQVKFAPLALQHPLETQQQQQEEQQEEEHGAAGRRFGTLRLRTKHGAAISPQPHPLQAPASNAVAA